MGNQSTSGDGFFSALQTQCLDLSSSKSYNEALGTPGGAGSRHQPHQAAFGAGYEAGTDLRSWSWYLLIMTNSSLLKTATEIVNFPSLNMVDLSIVM